MLYCYMTVESTDLLAVVVAHDSNVDAVDDAGKVRDEEDDDDYLLGANSID